MAFGYFLSDSDFKYTKYDQAAVLGYTSPVCHKIVREMLQQVKAVYGLDFTTDDRLFADLCVHVQTLKNGIIAPQIQHHVFGDELRNRYPCWGISATS